MSEKRKIKIYRIVRIIEETSEVEAASIKQARLIFEDGADPAIVNIISEKWELQKNSGGVG